MYNNIVKLLQFEPEISKEKIEKFSKNLKYANISYNEILELESIENFPLFFIAMNILSNLKICFESFHDKKNISVQRVKDFKSSSVYLNSYINSFEKTLEVLTEIDSSNLLNKELLETTIKIFKEVQENKGEAFKWLIAESLFYKGMSINEPLIKSLLKESHLNNIYHKSEYYSNLFEKYFMGLDLIENDFYKSTYIKLINLYSRKNVKTGYKDKNPKNCIINILSSMGCNIDLTSISTKNFYIKNFYSNIAIFSPNNSNASLENITSHYLSLIEPFIPNDLFTELENNFKYKLLLDL